MGTNVVHAQKLSIRDSSAVLYPPVIMNMEIGQSFRGVD